MKKVSSFSKRCLEIVDKIPKGKVATYGCVAKLAGNPHGAQAVGQALARETRKTEGTDVPWHRVINAKGELSRPGDDGQHQLRRLEQEGVEFELNKINLKNTRFLWDRCR